MTKLIHSKAWNFFLAFVLVFSLSPISSSLAYADEIVEPAVEKGVEAEQPTEENSNQVVPSQKTETSNSKEDVSGEESTAVEVLTEPEDGGSATPPDSEIPLKPASFDTIKSTAHVQNEGWVKPSFNSKTGIMTLGTTGKSLRVEAMTLAVDTELKGSIQYSTHVQNIGWQKPVADGKIAGTEGKSYRLEA